MQNDILKLADKTVAISGPCSSYLFDMASSLSRQGAAVVLITPDEAGGQRLCQVINDEREIKADYGRAAAMALKADKDTPEKIIADAAHIFHGLDIYIDNRSWLESPKSMDDADYNDRLEKHMLISTQLATAASTFLKKRKKGRMIFMLESVALDHEKNPQWHIPRQKHLSFIEEQAAELRSAQSIANAILLNLTEDLLLKHFPKQSLKESVAQMKAVNSLFDIGRTEAISKLVTFLSSDLAQGVSGQSFKLNT